MEEPPRWILLCNLNEIILIDRGKWQEKRSDYESVGISEAIGNLIVTEDGSDQSIDAMLIENKNKD